MSPSSTAAPSVNDDSRLEPKTDLDHSSMSEKLPDREPISDSERQIEPVQPVASSTNPLDPSQFPEGGRQAYLCLLGGFCCLFCSFGWLNCLGVFQSYYQRNQLRDYSPSTIAWIPSIQILVMFLPGPLVGWVYDNHGPKWILIVGTFFHVFGLMMTSLCTEYYQFVLAQGICSPLGLNCIFQAGTSTIPTWFLKKRGLAYGIMAAGSGLGGIIFPIMATQLIPQIGFAWTMRTIAFLILGLMFVALFTVASRLPPRPRALQLKVFLLPFKDIRFVLLITASFLFFLGIFIPINFIELQAIHSGMSIRLSGYLLAVLNALSIFGRIIPGALADKFGRFNMQSICSAAAGVIVLALGVPASGNAAFITFAALYGFASGAFVSLLPAQIAHISKVEQIGVNVGVVFAVVSIAGLVGNPIAGAIIDANHGDYWGLNVFAGVTLLAGAFMFTITRMYIANWKVLGRY